MGIVPDTRLGKIEFYETRIALWTTNAAAIGLAGEDVTALGLKTQAARDAYDAAMTARNAAKTATQVFHQRVSEMHSAPGAGQDMIDTIRCHAQNTDNPDVYSLADIPAPQPPSVAPPPGTPSNFTVNLLQGGELELKWKCDNPAGTSGTVYEITRRVGGSGQPFVFLANAGEKRFVDDTIPEGGGSDGSVRYRITAVRSMTRGNPALFTVTFGSVSTEGGGAGVGGLTISNEPSSTQAKAA